MSFIKDLITLDVVTVTGQINVKKKSTTDGDAEQEATVFSFDELFSNKKGKITIKADLRVIAASRIKVDQDTFTFVADQLDEPDKDLVALHMQSVDAAREARANIIAKLKPNINIGGSGEAGGEE